MCNYFWNFPRELSGALTLLFLKGATGNWDYKDFNKKEKVVSRIFLLCFTKCIVFLATSIKYYKQIMKGTLKEDEMT